MSSTGQPGGYFGTMQQGGGASAFTNPPINPAALAAILGMQQAQQQPGMPNNGLPQPAQTPGGQPSPSALTGLQPPSNPQAAAQGQNPQLQQALQMLQKLPPQQQQALMARIAAAMKQQQPMQQAQPAAAI